MIMTMITITTIVGLEEEQQEEECQYTNYLRSFLGYSLFSWYKYEFIRGVLPLLRLLLSLSLRLPKRRRIPPLRLRTVIYVYNHHHHHQHHENSTATWTATATVRWKWLCRHPPANFVNGHPTILPCYLQMIYSFHWAWTTHSRPDPPLLVSHYRHHHRHHV